jgi:hypothetical protein
LVFYINMQSDLASTCQMLTHAASWLFTFVFCLFLLLFITWGDLLFHPAMHAAGWTPAAAVVLRPDR